MSTGAIRPQTRVAHRLVAGAEGGYTLLETLLVLALTATTLVVVGTGTRSALDEIRPALAARYLEGRIVEARLRAVARSAAVGLRFDASGDDYRFAEYLDGNGNGIRSADIADDMDVRITEPESLSHGARFGLLPGVPEVDAGAVGPNLDGVRLGASRILTLGPDGSSSSGTLYVRSERVQYAVRILGATGRTRVLRFDRESRRWITR